MKHIRLPLTEADIAALQAGDEVLLSGPLYTARDAAHQRLCRCLQEGKPLPVELAGETIYYVGPSPAKPGEVIGSAGPTTSYRMDPYTPPLLALGLKGMIGKGRRSAEVVQAIREHGAVYFITIGGAAALLLLARRADALAASATRSSRSKNGFLPGFCATATTTSANRPAARRTISSCPSVMGSKVPG